MIRRFFAVIEYDPETKMYVGIVPEIPGAHSQGKTLDELRKNLKEVIELCLDEIEEKEENYRPHFVGIQEIEVGRW